MKHRFTVEVETSMSWTDTRDYVKDAIASWGGQCFPGENEPDPRFEIGEHQVKVMKTRREK